MTDMLTEICDTTRAEVARRKAGRSIADLDAAAHGQSAPRGFEAALRRASASGFALIAGNHHNRKLVAFVIQQQQNLAIAQDGRFVACHPTQFILQNRFFAPGLAIVL